MPSKEREEVLKKSPLTPKQEVTTYGTGTMPLGGGPIAWTEQPTVLADAAAQQQRLGRKILADALLRARQGGQ